MLTTWKAAFHVIYSTNYLGKLSQTIAKPECFRGILWGGTPPNWPGRIGHYNLQRDYRGCLVGYRY